MAFVEIPGDMSKVNIFILDDQPVDIDSVLHEHPVTSDYKLVYGCKTIQECETIAKTGWSDLYVIYDNKWMNGLVYLQVRSIWKNVAFRLPVEHLWPAIIYIGGGVKSLTEYVDYYQEVSNGKYPPL
jgi:hypothetical protein